MKEDILEIINQTIELTESIKDLASKITHEETTDSGYWFKIDGELFGVNIEDCESLMLEDGSPFSQDKLNTEWELVEVLKVAAKHLSS